MTLKITYNQWAPRVGYPSDSWAFCCNCHRSSEPPSLVESETYKLVREMDEERHRLNDTS